MERKPRSPGAVCRCSRRRQTLPGLLSCRRRSQRPFSLFSHLPQHKVTKSGLNTSARNSGFYRQELGRRHEVQIRAGTLWHDSVRQRAGVLRGNGQPASAPVTPTGPSKAPVPQPHPEDPSFWKAPVARTCGCRAQMSWAPNSCHGHLLAVGVAPGPCSTQLQRVCNGGTAGGPGVSQRSRARLRRGCCCGSGEQHFGFIPSPRWQHRCR